MTPPPYPAFTGFEPCATIDPEAYFREKGSSAAYVPTKVLRGICEDRCFMRKECLTWALWFTDEGFWGGKTREERRVLRRELGIERDPSRRWAA